MPRFPAARLLSTINARHGTDFVLRRRYASGEQGAYRLADPASRRYVLKWSAEPAQGQRIASAVAICDQLRARGYPTPTYCYWGEALGGSYSIQSALPGSPPRTLTVALLRRLIALNELQVASAPAPATDWPRRLVDTVLHGGEGYCELESLRVYSAATKALLDTLQRIARQQTRVECATNDVVHFDFNPANILARRGSITGVIDWEGVCAGDAAFDLATLLFYTYESPAARALLWPVVRARTSAGALALYLAHLSLRQIDWSIRHHDGATVQRYLRIARNVIRDCGAATL